MTCCILAALLVAHIVAMIRRWGMYWGLVRVPDGVEFDTAYQRMRRWLARPIARRIVAVLAVIEVGAFGSWLTLEHGNHLYQIGDQAIGRLRGQTIVYAQVCGSRGARSVRLVFPRRQDGRSAWPESLT
jgi:hypothetical protein